ncbi:MAG: SpoIID/LytB domain-containing protein [Clostridiales bacterium]|nr:SpoIID/LytB domain-containing protein [Clostridiales bacterium]
MKPDVKIEIIYYGAAADWSFESGFYGRDYALRLLTQTAANPNAFLKALDRAVGRSAVILTVGALTDGGRTGLCSLLARALGMDYPPEGGLPREARPFDPADTRLGGCLESGPQAIFLLHSEKSIRDAALRQYVFPALSQRFSVSMGGSPAETFAPVAEQTVPVEVLPETEPAAPVQAVEAVPVPAAAVTPVAVSPPAAGRRRLSVHMKRPAVPSATAAPAAPVAETAEKTPPASRPEALETEMQAAALSTAVSAGPAVPTAAASVDPASAQPEPLSMPVPPEETAPANASLPSEEVEWTPVPARPEEDGQISAPPEEVDPSLSEAPDLVLPAFPAYKKRSGKTSKTPKSSKNTKSPENAQSNQPQELVQPAPPQPDPEPPVQPDGSAPQADKAVFFGFDTYAPVKKGKKVWTVLLVILLLLAVLAGGCFGYVKWFQPWQADRAYAYMSGLYGQEGMGNLPPSALSKFGGLYDVNPDVAGWLTLPNTAVDYPVTAPGAHTAAYYESHLTDGTWNRLGSLYTGCVPYPESYYRNMTIYGKDTGDGRMLSDLRRYFELDFYKAAPVITMDTLYTKGQWKIFSVFETNGEDLLDYSQSAFSDDTAFLTYLAALVDRSAIRTMVDLRADDEILTLVAKGGRRGVVLAARRVRAGESTQVDVSGAVQNPKPLPVTETASFSDALLLRFGLGQTAAPPVQPAGEGENGVQPDGSAADSIPASSTPSASSPPDASRPANSKPAAAGDWQEPRPDQSPDESGEPEPGGGFEQSAGDAGSLPSYPAVSPPAGEELIFTVRNQHDGDNLVRASASEIVAGVVEAEMGERYQMEALKAQSVAAYSWLLCSGAADGKNPRVYLRTPSAKTLEAVAATKGERALYNGAVVCTYYHDTSAGRTALPSDIWSGGDQPYLTSVESPLDQNNPKFQTAAVYRAGDVAVWVKEAYGLDISAVDKQNWFQVTYDDNGLYARRVLLGGTIWVKGPSLRNTLFTAARVGSGKGLRSSAYTVAYDPTSDCFTFTVKGYGHGVGMSQTGADEYAKQGWDYQRILQHYYTGITIG